MPIVTSQHCIAIQNKINAIMTKYHHQPEYFKSHLKITERPQLQTILQDKFQHGSDKPIMIFCLPGSFNAMEVVKHTARNLHGARGYELITPQQDLTYMDKWPVRAMVMHHNITMMRQPNCDDLCYAIDVKKKTGKLVIVVIDVFSFDVADAINERWKSDFETYAYHWTREGLVAWANEMHLNKDLIEVMKTITPDPTVSSEATKVFCMSTWKQLSRWMNDEDRGTPDAIEALCKECRECQRHAIPIPDEFPLLAFERILGSWRKVCKDEQNNIVNLEDKGVEEL